MTTLDAPQELLEALAGWSDSEFAMVAMGDDGENLKSRIVASLANLLIHIDSLNGQLRVLQQGHDWMYGEKVRLENALKDIASRAHANLANAGAA